MEASFLFLSHLLGKKIYTRDGRFLGRLNDVIVSLDDQSLPIVGAVLSKLGKKVNVSTAMVDLWRLARTRWTTAETEEILPLQTNETLFPAKEILYDRQIVDVNGAKVERVNDIRIVARGGGFYLSAVDVGFTGLARRLGVEGFVRRLAGLMGRELHDELIDWKFVQPLPEGYTSPLGVSLRREEIRKLHAGELADIIEELDRDERITLVQSMDVEDAADALEEAHPSVQTSVIRDLHVELAADILEEMEPAVAADVIDKLPEDVQESIMAAMEEEDRGQIRLLIQADEDSAASLMTVDFISCPETYTAAEALTFIREHADKIDSITYVYCLDESLHLQGVVSLRDLIIADSNDFLSDLMNQRLVTLGLDDKWEMIASQFLKLRFRALPVVDESSRMLGIVTFLHSFDELLPYYHKQVNAS